MSEVENKNLRTICPVCGMLTHIKRLKKTYTPTLKEQRKKTGRRGQGFSFKIIDWDVETLKVLEEAIERALEVVKEIKIGGQSVKPTHDKEREWLSVLNPDTRPVKPVLPNGGTYGEDHDALMAELKEVLAKRRID